MEAVLKWLPLAGCAVAALYLLMALGGNSDIPQIQTARATMAIAFAVLPYVLAQALRDAFGKP